jgi:hypothetical protein
MTFSSWPIVLESCTCGLKIALYYDHTCIYCNYKYVKIIITL